jgi:hypothetical protein
MAVYVDHMKALYGRMVMCHMIADTRAELLEMANRIGVQRRWLQAPSTYREHFDISLTKRALAVAAGAVEISWRQLGEKIRARRAQPAQEGRRC